ncbi:MAG: hypothetical protein LBI34_00635 [Puniceicoccales bacterium]|jgi:hypothetical protein|nr:hypothetical protein [Puniceicoccales bacterium]
MNITTVDCAPESLLHDYEIPVASRGENIQAVAHSVALTFIAIMTKVFGIRTHGDGAITSPAATLLTTPAGRDLLKKYIRLVSNHLQIIYSEYHLITQPRETSNFIVPETLSVTSAAEQNELQLQLPEQCSIRNRAAVQERLDEFAALLRQRGFVAYKDSHIILNPKTHFAVAMIYDETLGKICLHIRDTASDAFWEDGSWVNWMADIGQGLGLMPPVYADGDMFVRGCVEIFGAGNLQITGYSMGGGIGMFAGVRNSVPAVLYNPAFLSPNQLQFFPTDWKIFAQEHIQVISTSNDLLSRGIDNPDTGGLLPTGLFEGAQVYTTDPADGARGPASGLRNAVSGHFLSTLLFGLMRTALQHPELCEYALQILQNLPEQVQMAFIQQNAPLFARLLQAGMIAMLASRCQLTPQMQAA